MYSTYTLSLSLSNISLFSASSKLFSSLLHTLFSPSLLHTLSFSLPLFHTLSFYPSFTQSLFLSFFNTLSFLPLFHTLSCSPLSHTLAFSFSHTHSLFWQNTYKISLKEQTKLLFPKSGRKISFPDQNDFFPKPARKLVSVLEDKNLICPNQGANSAKPSNPFSILHLAC